MNWMNEWMNEWKVYYLKQKLLWMITVVVQLNIWQICPLNGYEMVGALNDLCMCDVE